MTAAVPPPRSDDAWGSSTTLNLIAATVARVEAKVDGGFDSIRRDYVPRIELDPRLAAITSRVQDMEDARESDERTRQERERDDRRERRNVRIALAGLVFTALGTTTGLLVEISHLYP